MQQASIGLILVGLVACAVEPGTVAFDPDEGDPDEGDPVVECTLPPETGEDFHLTTVMAWPR